MKNYLLIPSLLVLAEILQCVQDDKERAKDNEVHKKMGTGIKMLVLF